MLSAMIRGSPRNAKGHDVPDSAFRRSSSLARSATLLMLIATLSGCMTAKKAADIGQDSPAAASEPDNPQGLLAKGGTTASGRYVDPVIVKAPPHQQAKMGLPASPRPDAPSQAAAGFPPAPASGAAPGAAAGSIAGLSTQPTGVRASSVSIFSASPAPAGMAPAPQNAGGAAPAGGINAATGSVFSPRQPLGTNPCQSDSAGRPVNC
jgi:hypothetical protein